ncbi:MAG: hypothetical protein CMJ58_14805 [Planctomycetaceae bacterium]|nr:hypothetical protein [Planctomycetaceae bacterium]
MTRSLAALVVCLFIGCSSQETSDADVSTQPLLRDIQTIVAQHLGKTATHVDPDLTFAALGADDLDLVEITMTVEDELGISIRDDSLIEAAGADDTQILSDYLTVRAFASVAATAPKQAQGQTDQVVGDGNLRESQVGVFSELSRLPNPNGLVLVFVPRFEEVVALQEDRLGRDLDEAEIEDLRESAAVIALPPELVEARPQQQTE